MLKFSIPSRHWWQQAGFSLLIVTAVVAVESKSALSAYHVGGIGWAVISTVFAIIATFAFGHAANLKDDYRPQVRRRSFFTRCVAVAFALAPIGFFGSALKEHNVQARWEAYTSAAPGQLSAYQIDQATASDGMADTFERRGARERLTPPSTIDLAITDGEFWIAGFFIFSLLFASDALRIPKPMTDAEFQFLKRSLAAQKGAAKRKEAAKRREEAKKRANRKPLFGIVQGGKN